MSQYFKLSFLGMLIVVLLFQSCMASSINQLTSTVQTQILAIHNRYRLKHHAPPLVWDVALQRYAENYASQCVFKHSSSTYGENLAAGYPSVTAAITAWYAEGEDYSYSRPGFSHETGHFTQVVWVSSKKIGCGYVACDGKNGTPGKYLVCEYSPAGNVTNDGFFERNVLPAS